MTRPNVPIKKPSKREITPLPLPAVPKRKKIPKKPVLNVFEYRTRFKAEGIFKNFYQ